MSVVTRSLTNQTDQCDQPNKNRTNFRLISHALHFRSNIWITRARKNNNIKQSKVCTKRLLALGIHDLHFLLKYRYLLGIFYVTSTHGRVTKGPLCGCHVQLQLQCNTISRSRSTILSILPNQVISMIKTIDTVFLDLPLILHRSKNRTGEKATRLTYRLQLFDWDFCYVCADMESGFLVRFSPLIKNRN